MSASVMTNDQGGKVVIAPNGEEVATFATAPAGNQVASIDRRVSRK